MYSNTVMTIIGRGDHLDVVILQYHSFKHSDGDGLDDLLDNGT